jgi:hypothetical protein
MPDYITETVKKEKENKANKRGGNKAPLPSE